MRELVLRDYQKENVEFFVKNRRMYLTDDTGLGKTITMFSSHRAINGEHGLFVTAKFLLEDVAKKNEQWYQDDVLIYTGTKKQRQKIWEAYLMYPEGIKYIITSYGMLKEIQAYCTDHHFWPWDTVFFDEIHLGQSGLIKFKSRKDKSKNMTYAEVITKKVPNLIISTATPVRQNIGDFFGPLHLLDPKRFNNYYPYIYKYGIVTNGMFGIELERGPKNLIAFRKMLSGYMKRHLYEEVMDQLPPIMRDVVALSMSKEQEKYYSQLEHDRWMIIDDEIEALASNTLTKIIYQRQLLGCPRTFNIDDIGTAFEYMENELESLNDNASIVIFAPFRKTASLMFDMLKHYGYSVHIGIGGDNIIERVEVFNNDSSNKKVWIGTIDSAVGYDLFGISNIYFIGAHDSPTMNKQAEGRCLGMRQTRPIHIKLLLYNKTIHANLLQRLTDKQAVIDWTTLPQSLFQKKFKNM